MSSREENYARFLRDAPVRLVLVFTHPVHDVQFTAKSLDGAADLQQLEPQSIVYGQAGSHPVGEVWQKPGRRGEEGWNEGVGGEKGHTKQTCTCAIHLSSTERTYGVGRERVVLQILIPFVELFLHSVHERLLQHKAQEVSAWNVHANRNTVHGVDRCTHRVVKCVHPGRPRSQTGTVKLPLRGKKSNKTMRNLISLRFSTSDIPTHSRPGLRKYNNVGIPGCRTNMNHCNFFVLKFTHGDTVSSLFNVYKTTIFYNATTRSWLFPTKESESKKHAGNFCSVPEYFHTQYKKIK